MIIYFLRHANAGVSMSNLKRDEKRALDKEGIEQCGIVGIYQRLAVHSAAVVVSGAQAVAMPALILVH